MPFAATWMDPESVILSEVSQMEKEKYLMIALWNLKRNATNELTKQRLIDLEDNLTAAAGRTGEGIGSLGWTCTHCYN